MSGNEPVKLNFGKNLGHIELKKNVGIQQNAFNDDGAAISIFNRYNNDKNIVLDESEWQNFCNDLADAAGKDKKLSAHEAVKFLKSIGIKNVKVADARNIIQSFLNVIDGDKNFVKTATRDDKNNVTVTYTNDMVEIYKYDAESKQSVLYKQEYADETGNHIITYDSDGKTKASEVIRTLTLEKTVEYKNGEVARETTLKDYASDDISVGAELVPNETVGIRIIKDANGNIKQEFLDSSDNGIEILATREISADAKTVIQKDAEGNETVRFEENESGNMRQIFTSENGIVKIIDGDKETTKFSENRTMLKTSDEVKVKEGDKEVALKYDDEGHIIAYAKEGENFKATAKRLGIDINNEAEYREFCELNSQAVKRSHGGWFKIGEPVKLPAGFEARLHIEDYEVDIKAQREQWKEKTSTKNISPEPEVFDTNSEEVTSGEPLAFSEKIPRTIEVPPVSKRADRPKLNVFLDTKSYPDKASQTIVLDDGSSVTYDESGYIKEVKNQNGQTTRKISRNKNVCDYIYNNDGTLKQEYHYEYVPNNIRDGIFVREEYYDYVYDKNGKLKTKILRYEPLSANNIFGSKFGTAQFISNYIYDKQGNLIAEAEYSGDDGCLLNIYDKNGNSLSLDNIVE